MTSPLSDPPDDLEAELRQWQPAPLPEPLAERLLATQRDCRASSRPARAPWHRHFVRFGLLAAAVAFSAGAFFYAQRSLPDPEDIPGHSANPGLAGRPPARSPGPVETAATPRFQPVGWSNTILSAADEGIVFNDTRGPARRVRYESVETFQFRDPATGATIDIDVPREEIVLVGLDPL